MGRKAIICFSTHSDKDDSSKKTAIIFFAAGCLSAAGLLAAFYAGMRIKAPKEEEQSMPSRPPRSFVNTRRNRSSNNLNDGKPPSSVHVMPLRRKKSESRYGLRTRLDPKMVSPIIDGIQSKVHEEANRKALTVGVAGGSGSGKTTFAQALYHAVGEENVTYITHDNYYKDLSHLPVKERAVHNFDHPESLDTALLVEHLRCLKRSQNVNIPVYDFSTHSRSSKVVTLAEPRQVIIVEGILIFSDLVLVRELDIKVFVDTEADVRLIRRIHRDVKERGRTLDSIIEQYVKTVRPMHMEFVEPSKTKADVIIPSGINQVALDMFLSRLRSEIDGSNGGGGTSELASFSTGMDTATACHQASGTSGLLKKEEEYNPTPHSSHAPQMAPPIDPSPRGGYGTILSNAIATSATASDISTSYDSDINDHPYHQLPRVPVFGAKLKPPKRRVPQTHLLAGGLLISSLLLAIILVGLERYDRSLSTVDTTHPGMKLQSTLSRPRAATTLSHKRQEEKRSREVTTSSGAVAEADTSLQFEVENRYGKHTYQDSLYPWLDGKKLIETGMGTSLRILDPIDDATYVWTIYYSVDGSEEEAEDEDQLAGSWTGNEISVVLSTPGTYLAVLQALDATEDDKNTLLSTSKETIYVKYVRREIRGLLPIDREAFMDAAHTVWTVSEEEGQKLYGPDYKDIYYFTGYHLTMAGLKYCDHMHDGLGFMTQHVALTMKLEQVLRTINPSVSMPYWDYTIDVEHIDNNLDYEYSDNWFKAEVFTDEYFGEVDPIEHTVTKGRWAYTEVGKSSFDVKNAYGLMRAPWNCNKNKYVTRYSDFCGQSWVGGTENMPSCSTHYNMVAEYNTWDEFGTELPYIPHGTIHSSTGGSFNCDESFNAMKDLGLSDDFLQYYSLWSFGYQRKWYRYDLLTCPTDCSEDTPQSECLCSCDVDKVLSKYDDSLDSVLEALVDVEEYRGEVTALSEDDQRTFVQLVCDAGILVGDHLEAASPADISFWPIHPAIERLWVYKKLKGFFTDEDWPSGSSIYTDCRGHDYNDTIPLAGLMEDPDLYYTNGELYSLMDPSISSLPYIFDNFDWQHCLDQQGIDFSQVEMGVGISSTSSSSSSAVAKARKQRKGQQSRNRRKSAAAH